MAWIPQVGRMDAFEPGQEFTIFDGQDRPVHVESFAQMRKIERENERQVANGEAQPIRFRALHQGRSNRDVNTFGEPPNQRPSAEAKRKFGLRGGARPVQVESGGAPEVVFGPAVNESNCSALKD